MTRLAKRLADIEARMAPARPAHWHWVIGNAGESHDEARARYEQEQGPTGANEGAVIWRNVG